jgi:hypothetical protein
VATRCSTRSRHWRHVDSRAAADEGTKTMDRKHLLLLCLSTLAVRVTVTCNKK